MPEGSQGPACDVLAWAARAVLSWGLERQKGRPMGEPVTECVGEVT